MTPESPEPRPQNRTTVRTNPWALRAVRAGLSAMESHSPALAACVVEHIMFRTTRVPTPPKERVVLERGRPFDVHTPHGKVAAIRWGSGPAVLLVHGWNGRGTQLGAFVAPLVDRGFEVIAFDAPGHGASTGSSSSLVHFADAIDAVIDAVRPTFGPIHGLVAHSMGGAAATYAMSRFRRTPETRLDRALRDAELPCGRFVFVAPPIDVRDFVRATSGVLGIGQATMDSLRQRVEARLSASLDTMYAPRAARDLHAPLLVVHDEDDREVPLACGRALASAWPGATLEVTRGLGHKRILWDDHIVRRIAAFVSAE